MSSLENMLYLACSLVDIIKGSVKLSLLNRRIQTFKKSSIKLSHLKGRTVRKNIALYILLFPTLSYFLVFRYIPIYGLQIAFKDYNPFVGFTASPWVGIKHFKSFFESIYFWRLIRNTFLLSFYSILFGFPVPILFAILLNELKSEKFRSTVQTISYMPHFLSTVIVAGLIVNFLSPSIGVINKIIEALGGNAIDFLRRPEWFRTIYISSGIWQGMGWNSIIYYASLRAISPSLYEAADIDGANRRQKMIYISLPGILPTIVTLLLLNLGNLLSVGFEKVFLLYNATTYETADVLSTYVYRSGLISQQYSFATAVGLFNSVVTLVLLIFFNSTAKKTSGESLW
jgi:putative aldouronate transport system permease protein